MFRNRQSNVRWLLGPASDYCRARGNQILEHSSDKETVLRLGSSRKLGGAAENLIDGSEKTEHLSVALWILEEVNRDISCQMYVIQILPRGVEYKIIWFLVISARYTWDEDY